MKTKDPVLRASRHLQPDREGHVTPDQNWGSSNLTLETSPRSNETMGHPPACNAAKLTKVIFPLPPPRNIRSISKSFSRNWFRSPTDLRIDATASSKNLGMAAKLTAEMFRAAAGARRARDAAGLFSRRTRMHRIRSDVGRQLSLCCDVRHHVSSRPHSNRSRAGSTSRKRISARRSPPQS